MNVLLIDEDEKFMKKIKSIFIENNVFENFYYAPCGKKALNIFKDKKINLVILSVALKCVDAISVIKSITYKDNQCKTIVLSKNCREKEYIKFYNAGARGYIDKSLDSNAMQKVVDDVMNGQGVICECLLKTKSINIFKKIDELKVKQDLSTREKEIFILMLKGFSREKITQRLFISKHTFSTHRGKILNKLKAKSTVELIKHYNFIKANPRKQVKIPVKNGTSIFKKMHKK